MRQRNFMIVGLLMMVSAITAIALGATKTERGRKMTKDARRQAMRAAKHASTYMEMVQGRESDRSRGQELTTGLIETWGRVKGWGRAIDYIDVHLEDGSTHRLEADRLDKTTKLELIGRSHRA